ncbi:2-oxoglutarate dehydrogenase complex dihydrolipoyllysine-residue succinyltransferase [Inmirania thermothiophila]|uniref:Dihydrolipoyllysine-residue succinyltransferase component of 2-oxoglutarate dehydrogenase complex n=1 Tax=Inmirania thermothiophila TaxID=1750597 RepID=A0A3N1Y892_9GAMM|nr:2-oxoglutarate dehydrogenase complex dihydrolipoyllysine-residue succinyltransferase [Inmirania thermothiophila]ROR35005.1 2-oxoglutarate dehydrogenase E2 component [Inmirania thermothiophila]
MRVEVKVPVLPESVADATVLAWHKKPGDPVRRDENLVDIETDKVVLDVPAPQDGVLAEIVRGEGETVLAGELLAVVETDGAAAAPAASAEAAAQAAAPAAQEAPAGAAPPLSPAVRRLVEEHGLDPSQIQGSGKGGRILKEDVLRHIEAAKAAAPAAPQAAASSVMQAAPAETRPEVEAPAVGGPGQRPERRVPMTRLRQRIAQRLKEAQNTAAILTTFNEVNMKPVMDLRARYRDRFEKEHGIRLGFMSFFVKAAVEALKRFPEVNASIDGADIVYHGYYDIGVAVSSPRGLVVPIIRDADQLSFAEIEKTIADFAVKARDGRLSIEELTGGTFSISNGGIFGSLNSTPILNPPQSAILGMHKIQERPVVENGEIVIRPMMYLALSYDHRIIDGREAVQFLVTIKDCIEDPARMLLEI